MVMKDFINEDKLIKTLKKWGVEEDEIKEFIDDLKADIEEEVEEKIEAERNSNWNEW